MMTRLLASLLFVLANEAWAHRLDEYLQATRIAVATNRIDLSIDFTPGVAIVDRLMTVLDSDRDGIISEEERSTYAQRVLKDIQVGLDEKVLVPRLVDISFPELQDIRTGLGVIQIKATALVGSLTEGRHALSLTNTHLPAISVYLVNALAPKDRAITIRKQSRDEFQQGYRLEFGVSLSLPPRNDGPSGGVRK